MSVRPLSSWYQVKLQKSVVKFIVFMRLTSQFKWIFLTDRHFMCACEQGGHAFLTVTLKLSAAPFDVCALIGRLMCVYREREKVQRYRIFRPSNTKMDDAPK